MKKQITFLILILVMVMVVAGCEKKQLQPKDNQIVSNNQGQENQQNRNLTNKQEWRGKIINEANGWKKYVNDYYGIEFKFKDKEGVILNDENKSNIQMAVSCSKEVSYCAKNPQYIELSLFSYKKDEYRNLKEFLEKNWTSFWQTNASWYKVKKEENSNNVDIYQFMTDLGVTYYSDCRDNWSNEDSHDIYQDYLSIQCKNLDKICDNIISTLQID